MSDLTSAARGAACDLVSAGAFDKEPDQSSATDAPAPVATVPSPCVDICKIDGDTGLCIGCLRTRDEIRGWKNMTDDLRVQMIDELSLRKAKLETEKAQTP
ncbi:DUF1289 domain-containing protein [Paraburkholderia haematera]|uniref:DUF1289 domain-containing protein n=1 Tax=Paraburkholderia haematera TaxID=2793077 RepID=UPI001B8D1FA2|nr:DUF1289 domain-containing protein [Paraburkholderia haematera]